MFVYLIILLSFLAGDLIWWRWSDLHARRLRGRRVLRPLIGLVGAFESAYVLMKLLDMCVELPQLRVLWIHVLGYVWHIIVLPLFVGAWALYSLARWWRRSRNESARKTSDAPVPEVSAPELSRRDVMGTVAGMLPVFACAGLAGATMRELSGFRISRITLDVPQLPDDLDGLKIIHLSDLHIGQFLPVGTERKVADAANALEGDVVVFTGDLLDISARKVQPGVEFLRMLNPRQGLVMIEGNHDGMGRKAAGEFEETMKSAGAPLLLNETMTMKLAGRKTPVQFLGEAWGRLTSGRELKRWGKEAGYWFRVRDEEAVAEVRKSVLAKRQPSAFSILLAHHPHSFDYARADAIPLTLAGHTHGGQLMLNDKVGVGPLRFRYWSGVYRNGPARLFVNNGIGSWFPMRINAPPEIVVLTLKRGSTNSADA